MTKFKSYNFWIRLVSAVLLLLRIIGSEVGFEIDSNLFMDIATAVAGVLVVMGIISAPTSTAPIGGTGIIKNGGIRVEDTKSVIENEMIITENVQKIAQNQSEVEQNHDKIVQKAVEDETEVEQKAEDSVAKIAVSPEYVEENTTNKQFIHCESVANMQQNDGENVTEVKQIQPENLDSAEDFASVSVANEIEIEQNILDNVVIADPLASQSGTKEDKFATDFLTENAVESTENSTISEEKSVAFSVPLSDEEITNRLKLKIKEFVSKNIDLIIDEIM